MGARFETALREFVGRGNASQRAIDQVLATKRDPALELARRIVAPSKRGKWIHFGPCGGQLVRLQGKKHPICRRCAREVF